MATTQIPSTGTLPFSALPIMMLTIGRAIIVPDM
jgi:hypothetical protein